MISLVHDGPQQQQLHENKIYDSAPHHWGVRGTIHHQERGQPRIIYIYIYYTLLL